MDEVLLDYYTNELGRISPGIACGDFRFENKVGCFKLLTRSGRVTRLVYHDLSTGRESSIYDFVPPDKNVFIEKIYETELKSSKALPQDEEVILQQGQPSLRLVFFGKSAVVFYWKSGAFHSIWTAD